MKAISSGELTASALIKPRSGKFFGILVHTDGTNAVTINIYDGTDASGAKLIGPWTVTTSASDRTQYLPFSTPILFQKGCYVQATSAGAFNYTVFYS